MWHEILNLVNPYEDMARAIAEEHKASDEESE